MADLAAPTVTGPGSTFLQSLQLPSSIANTQANTAFEQAQTGAVGAQTQSTNLANQLAQLKLSGMGPLLQSLNAPAGAPSGSGAPPSSGSASSGDGGATDPGEAAVFQQFAPIPTARPAQVAQKVAAATILYGPEAGNAIGAQYDAQVAGVNQNRQLAANNAYQAAATVESAPAGQAKAVLERINPQLASALEAKYANDPPDKLDADLRGYARTFGLNAYQYSGRSSHFDNGVMIDDKNGTAVVGSEQILTGLDAKGKASALADANTPVTVGAGLPQPRWQAMGYPSASAYVIAADKAARTSAAPPAAGPVSAAPATSSGTPGGNIVSGATAPATAPAAPPAAITPRAPAPVTPPQPTDPALKAALADTTFRQQPPPRPTDQPSLAAATDQAKATVAARTGLLQQAATDTSGAATADTYLKAAQQIMAGKGAPTAGLPGTIANEITRVFNGVNSTNYQEVAKYLGNAALQNARQTYGARMTQKEVDLQLHELSPSTTMTPDAINDLIGQMRAQAGYSIASAARTRQYLTAGNDPQQFEVWNQKYFPRQQIVSPAGRNAPPSGATATPTATGPNGQKLILVNGQWTPRPGGASGSW